MSAKDVVERGLAAWRARDADAFAALYTEDAVIAGPGGMELHGPDGARGFMAVWNEGFPDNDLSITKRYECGSVVIEEGTFHGTHTGTLHTPDGQTVPATGRSVSADYIDVFEIDGDRVRSERVYFDRVDMLTQLGLMPEPAAAAAS